MKYEYLLDGPLGAKCELDTAVEVQTTLSGYVRKDNPIVEWTFHVDGNSVSWDDLGIEDRLTVAREFVRRWYVVEGDVIPWGEDIETLVALEGM